MSIWKEIRCDYTPANEDCLSNFNIGPKGFEDSKELIKQAQKEGWIIRNGEATCPICKRRGN